MFLLVNENNVYTYKERVFKRPMDELCFFNKRQAKG